MTVIKRFLSKTKIDEETGCWNWQAYKNKKGYGCFYSPIGTLAHRFSYYYHFGDIKKGMQVCHSCDNPACVNPNHLWLGTNQDNQIDCSKKGRARRNSPKGSQNGQSKLTEDHIKQIKNLSKNKSQKEIANIFNLHQTTVHYILTGKTWSHVT